MVTKNLEYVPIIWLWGQKTLYFWPKTQFLSTLRPYNPLFWPQTNPAQWDHIFPISSGNSGYLRFSGRCPFGRSAGHFPAPIAQNGPFWAENAIFRRQQPPRRPPCNVFKTKNLAYMIFRHEGNRKFGIHPKILPLKLKNTVFLAPKYISFYAMTTFRCIRFLVNMKI